MGNTKHVFILGIDGAGNAVKDTQTPNIDRVFSSGAYTYRAKAAIPTISAECWGAILLGVHPEKHGLTNDVVSSRPHPPDSRHPSLFRLIRQRDPGAKLASFSAWGPINAGIIEQNLDCEFETTHDDDLVRRAAAYIVEHRPAALFLQLDDCDGAGHSGGYFTEKHLRAVQNADRNIGQILEAIQRAGIWDDSLIIVTADHGGGGDNPKSHGSDHPRDVTVFWGCCGPNIRPVGEIPDSVPVHIVDTAPMAARALGLPAHSGWDGRVIEEVIA